MGELDKHWGRVVVNENILHNKYMLSFCQKLFFLNQTPSCICSMCLHCIGNFLKYQIFLSKAVVEVDRPMKAPPMHIQKTSHGKIV